MQRLLEGREARAFTAGEAEKGREFTRGENREGRQFAREEAGAGRQFSREERMGTQDWQGGQAREARQFGMEEAQRGRDFSRGERQEGQQFQGQQAELARNHATAMQHAQQVYDWMRTEAGYDQATAEREANQAFQKTLAGLQFANQISMERDRGQREDARMQSQQDYDARKQALMGALGLMEKQMQDPTVRREDVLATFNTMLPQFRNMLSGKEEKAESVDVPTGPATAKSKRTAMESKAKESKDETRALMDAYMEGLKSPNADGTRGSWLGGFGRSAYGALRGAGASMSMGAGLLLPSPQERAMQLNDQQATQYMLDNGFTPEEIERARKLALENNKYF
jgi:hypothetical protein